MAEDPRARADARLDAALEGAGIADPRPYYRSVLKHLRERDPEAFARALRYFDEQLVPQLAGDADPIDAWLQYGRLLARELGPGRTVSIGPSGRAHPADEAAPDRALLMFIPDDDAGPALLLRRPVPGTRAQDAAVELLVEGRVVARAYEGGRAR